MLKEANLPVIKTFSVEDKLGRWATVQKPHFADGGVNDHITTKQN